MTINTPEMPGASRSFPRRQRGNEADIRLSKSPTWLTRHAAAAFLSNLGYPIAPQTLARAACQGWGPGFVRWGRRPLYQPAELKRWAVTRVAVAANLQQEVRA